MLDHVEARGPGLAATGALTLGPHERIDGNATARLSLESSARCRSAHRSPPTGESRPARCSRAPRSRPAVAVISKATTCRCSDSRCSRRSWAACVRMRATSSIDPRTRTDGRTAGGQTDPGQAGGNDMVCARVRLGTSHFLPSRGCGHGRTAPYRSTARLGRRGLSPSGRGSGTGDTQAGGSLALSEIAWNDRPLGAGTLEMSSPGPTFDAELRLADLKAVASAPSRHRARSPRHPCRAAPRRSPRSTRWRRPSERAGRSPQAGTTTLRATLEGEASQSAQRFGSRVSSFSLDGAARGVRFRLPGPRALLRRPATAWGSRALELAGEDLPRFSHGRLSERGDETLDLRVWGDLPPRSPAEDERRRVRCPRRDGSGWWRGSWALRVVPGPRPTLTHRRCIGRSRRAKSSCRTWPSAPAFHDGALWLERLSRRTTKRVFALTASGEAGAGLLTASAEPPPEWPPFLREALQWRTPRAAAAPGSNRGRHKGSRQSRGRTSRRTRRTLPSERG